MDAGKEMAGQNRADAGKFGDFRGQTHLAFAVVMKNDRMRKVDIRLEQVEFGRYFRNAPRLGTVRKQKPITFTGRTLAGKVENHKLMYVPIIDGYFANGKIVQFPEFGNHLPRIGSSPGKTVGYKKQGNHIVHIRWLAVTPVNREYT